MNSLVLFEQLLVLLALMFTGFISYKTKLVDDATNRHLSSFMVWVLNPFLMLSGVLGKDSNISGELVMQNLIMVGVLYLALFLFGFLYVWIFRLKGKQGYLYRLSMQFSNVGFMGVPLVKEIFGAQYIIYVAFYLLAFNVICYSYGVYLASSMGENKEKFQWKKLLSPGTFSSVIAILIFVFHISVPAPIETFVNYLGDTSIAMSMIIIGISLAQMDWKSAFSKKEYYIFSFVRMFLIPLVLVYFSNFLPFDKTVIGVYQIMICMPVASMTCMLSQEYSGDGSEAAKIISITTILTVISAPLIILLTS